MLPVNIGEVAAEDVASLVNEKVTERRTLEYKEKLPGGSDLDKKEFLADVCSFANLIGGDILYGIRDERDGDGKPTGIPESVVGLAGLNLSAERERLESIIRNGIQPRIPNVQSAELQMEEHGPVLLLRIARRIKPHMVTFKGTSRFYSRHSTGKYQLDVQEIGQAFAEQRSLGERMREWRMERIAKIIGEAGPVILEGPSRFLLHFGMRLSLSNPDGIGVQHTFDRDVIQTPEVEIDRMEPKPYRDSLLPVVDSIWQANGYEGTQSHWNWGLDANRKPLLGK